MGNITKWWSFVQLIVIRIHILLKTRRAYFHEFSFAVVLGQVAYLKSLRCICMDIDKVRRNAVCTENYKSNNEPVQIVGSPACQDKVADYHDQRG